MANKARGESELIAGGKSYRLLLTLGALAEIESGLGLADLAELPARLKQTRAADLAVVAAALLRGGGHEMNPAEVLRLACDLGALVEAITGAFEAAGVPERKDASPRPFAGANCSSWA
ncbi:MAG TPA: GTA-gp10 family protein [Rhizomicrobium sp.]|nr:GTA-gp10 family protein [Rhizomicrobium sp.]